eukprot:1640086-Rhodomonas_salina.1
MSQRTVERYDAGADRWGSFPGMTTRRENLGVTVAVSVSQCPDVSVCGATPCPVLTYAYTATAGGSDLRVCCSTPRGSDLRVCCYATRGTDLRVCGCRRRAALRGGGLRLDVG